MAIICASFALPSVELKAKPSHLTGASVSTSVPTEAAGRLLAETGATAKMIMSVLGHTTLAEAERDMEETGLAEDAVIEREGHKANRDCPNHFRGFGENVENQSKIRKAWRWRSLGESNPCFSLERAAS